MRRVTMALPRNGRYVSSLVVMMISHVVAEERAEGLPSTPGHSDFKWCRPGRAEVGLRGVEFGFGRRRLDGSRAGT